MACSGPSRYGGVEAHILRRIFTTLRIDNDQTDELTTTLVMTYHQDGMQAAIGPCVKACHNQCILEAERMVSTFVMMSEEISSGIWNYARLALPLILPKSQKLVLP